MKYVLEGTGVWSQALRYGDPANASDAAAELEELGYSSLWIPDVGGDLWSPIENLLSATTSITVATGILNIWMHDAAEVAQKYTDLVSRYGDRVLLGLGISHALLIDGSGIGSYERPLERTRAYLDELDDAGPALGSRRMLAALGPKMLSLARERTSGVHTYLATPEHTAIARECLGPERLLVPEQAVVLEGDPERARGIAREHLAGYMLLPNYSNNWKRLGFDDSDLADGGSDRLVDALVAWGDDGVIADRVQAHRDAGADSVCVQVLEEDMMDVHIEQLRALAPVLVG